MAELVDAPDLGSGEQLLVGVRVSPAAHFSISFIIIESSKSLH